MAYNQEAVETDEQQENNEDERKIFIGGLSWQSTDKDIKSYFEKFGAIEKVTLKTDNFTGESRGFGFVVFEDPSSIEAVMAEQTHTLNGKKIGPRRAKARPKPEPILKVFIGGLDPDVPEADIKAHFEMFGTITEIDLPFDKIKNQRRAFAFVKYESEDVVNTVIASNNAQGKQILAGKEVDIKKHTPKTDAQYHAQYGFLRGGGRGRGFGGRGRGRGGFPSFGGYGGYDYYQYGGYGGGYDYTQDYGYGYGPSSRGTRGMNRGRGRGFTPY